jgi:lipopolysaccharide transport system ATP-binding protein
LKKKEIDQKLEAIIDFSGVERFIDMPLKHYSSGMQLRLAFSVAAHLEPEILLIDEVLAVGDMEFQKKCLGKMEEISKKEGRTILFVSHDLSAISRLTNSCILLDQGKIISNDVAANTINVYNNRKKEQQFEYINNTFKNKPQITGIRVITSDANNIHIHGEPLKIEFEINVSEQKNGLALSFQLMNTQMQPILHFWVVDGHEHHFGDKGKYIIQCLVPQTKLYKGEYSLSAFLGEDRGKEVFDFIQDVTPFEVLMTGLDPGHSFGWQSDACIYRENHEWRIQKR